MFVQVRTYVALHGCFLCAGLQLGDIVVRGPDWKWEIQVGYQRSFVSVTLHLYVHLLRLLKYKLQHMRNDV